MENSKNKTEEKVYTLGEVGSLLESLDGTMKMMSENYSSLVNGQGDIKERLDKMDVKIDRLQDDMVEVKFDLKRKVSQEEIEKLEKRVVKLEKNSYARN